ncbi:MAG: PDZ domain-containing protein [Zoogloeaceae bacterium]|jgi:predicted metalloprotease with PDZ domain|nr:PDZ domain-containing protein [Zoogloeaceae bacterium]
MSVRYTLAPRYPAAHLFTVTCQVDSPAPEGQRFSLPAWIQGSYLIRDFARHIVTIRAEADGRPVALEKIDKATWLAAPCRGTLTLIYEVFAWDLSVRAAHFDRQHAFFNASSVFLYPQGRETEACLVELLPPEEEDCAGWRVASSLPRAGAPAWGFGRYRAQNYADLLDHPVEMGNFVHERFSAQGVPHHLIVTGGGNFDGKRLCRDLARICAWQMAFFGEPALADPYFFLTMAVDAGYGGLEHRNSSVLLCERGDLPAPGLPDTEYPENYVRFLGLASHEYFHRWNVKRIHPAALAGGDRRAWHIWQEENYTRLLWFFEGVTSYYDDLCLVRAGLISEAAYLELLGKTLTQVRRTPGRHRQSLADASFDAWIKYYRPDANSPNAQISYYSKGALLALWLDLELRRKSGGRTSLDDLMRDLWRTHGQHEKGLEEEEIFQRVAILGGKPLGHALREAVFATGDLPLEKSLASCGVRLEWQAGQKTPWLGMRSKEENGRVLVTHVLSDSPAEQAGLAPGDVLVALEGREIGKNLESSLGLWQAGQTLDCHYFRHGLLAATRIVPVSPPADTARLTALSGAKARQKRKAWLAG